MTDTFNVSVAGYDFVVWNSVHASVELQGRLLRLREAIRTLLEKTRLITLFTVRKMFWPSVNRG